MRVGEDVKMLLFGVLGSVLGGAVLLLAAWIAGLMQAAIAVPVWMLILTGAVALGAFTWLRLARNRRVYRCNDKLYHEFGEPVVDQASRAGTVWYGEGGTAGVQAFIFGPYDGLRAGTYLVAFRMKVSITQPGAYAYFDVAHGRGSGPVLPYREGHITADSGGHYADHLHRIVVARSSSSDKWEWRVRLPVEGIKVWADTVTVKRISADTTEWESVLAAPASRSSTSG